MARAAGGMPATLRASSCPTTSMSPSPRRSAHRVTPYGSLSVARGVMIAVAHVSPYQPALMHGSICEAKAYSICLTCKYQTQYSQATPKGHAPRHPARRRAPGPGTPGGAGRSCAGSPGPRAAYPPWAPAAPPLRRAHQRSLHLSCMQVPAAAQPVPARQVLLYRASSKQARSRAECVLACRLQQGICASQSAVYRASSTSTVRTKDGTN